MTSPNEIARARGRVIDLFCNLLWYNRNQMFDYSNAVEVTRKGLDPRYYEYQEACRFVADMEGRGEEIVKEILGVSDLYELADYERLLENTLERLDVAKPKDGILETLWGAIQGGFNEEPSGIEIAIDIGIGLIPVAGQLADARDILACMKKLGTNGKSDDVMVWVELILALIGFIPGIGDTLKGIVKSIQKAKDREAVKFIKKLAGSDDIMEGLDRASRLFERLRLKVVQKLADKNAPMVDQAFQIIKKIIDDFKKKIGKNVKGLQEQISVTIDGKKQTVSVKEILNMLDNSKTSKRVIEIPEEAIAVIREGIEHQRILAQATEKKKSIWAEILKKGKNGNFGYAETDIEGLNKKEFFAYSKIDSTKEVPGISPEPENPQFKPFYVGGNNRIINSEKGYIRSADTEHKILNDIANRLGNRRDAVGTITLFTERHPCASCILNIKQFESVYQNITVIVYTNDGKFIRF